jgi:hypothetical protein
MIIGRYYLNLNPLLSVKTAIQLGVALIASALLMHWLGGVNFWTLLTTLLVTYALKDTLAPATGFWRDFPSWFSVCLAAFLVIASIIILPAWIAVVAVSAVFGLGVGRFISSKVG